MFGDCPRKMGHRRQPVQPTTEALVIVDATNPGLSAFRQLDEVIASMAINLAAQQVEDLQLDELGLDHGAAVLAAVHAYNLRATDVVAMRSVKGKGVASAAALLMEMTAEELRTSRAVIDTPNQDAAREFVRFIRDNMGGIKP